MVNRLLETGTDGDRHVSVWNHRRIVDGCPKRCEVTGAERRVDGLESSMFDTTLVVVGHDAPGQAAPRSLRPAGELSRLGVHFDSLAFLDEERHAHFEAGFENRDLRDAATGRVASVAVSGCNAA